MENNPNRPLTHLTRRDPTLNVARFYGIDLQPTLFGETAVIRIWGRIGTRGQMMIKTFDQNGEALLHADFLQHQKRRRGYL